MRGLGGSGSLDEIGSLDESGSLDEIGSLDGVFAGTVLCKAGMLMLQIMMMN